MKFSKEIKAGLIALLAIVGFVVLFQFMKGKSVFSSDAVYYAKYENVQGLTQSSVVSINGLKVGQVNKIAPVTDKSGKIYFVVKLSIDKTYQFSKNSTVEIFEPGLMSGKEVRVNLSYGGPTAQSGDTLKSGFQLGLMSGLASQVGPVKDQLEVVLHRVDSLMANANLLMNSQNREEIKMLLSNLNKTVGAMQNTATGITSLVGNNDPKLQKMLDEASSTMDAGKSTLNKYGELAQSIDTQKLNATIDNLNQTVGKLNQVIDGVENGNGSLGKMMKNEDLYNNLNATTQNLNALLEDLKSNPKKYLNISVFGKNNKD